MISQTPSIGVLIRFSDSASTLPAVLDALRQQTLQPNVLLGVNSGGTDTSSALVRAAGGSVIEWPQPYAHSRVLNFGIQHLPTDLVLILSSHTVLESQDTLAQMVAAMHDPAAACVSLAWDDDPFYSNAITSSELQQKGLRFGSFYSNSMGMIRRRLWKDQPFDESLPTAEDYAWTLEQIKKGFSCIRLHLPFSYRRDGNGRAGQFARVVFHLAKKHALKVTWLGPLASIKTLVNHQLNHLAGRTRHGLDSRALEAIKSRLAVWVASLFTAST